MIQNKWKIFKQKNIRLAKQKHAFKGFSSTYNVEILNSFNPELQLKDTESSIKSKLIEVLTKLKGSKLVTALVLEFKKVESEDKTSFDKFIQAQKQK